MRKFVLPDSLKYAVCLIVFTYAFPSVGLADPTVDFTYSFPLACEENTIQFVNNSSTLSGTLIYTIWDFGDQEGSTVFSPAHTYKEAGDYTVKLTVQNSNGDFDVISRVIKVNPRPQVDFELAGTDQCTSTVQSFTNLSTIPSNDLTYLWDFGDNSTSTDEEPIHSFIAGTYTVTLTATSSSTSCTETIAKQVVIHPEVTVDFSTTTECLGNTTVLINESTQINGIVNWSWNFGDGQTSFLQQTSHLYDSPGDYTVTLQATTGEGCITSSTKSVSVQEQPVASFGVNSDCFAVDATFTNSSSFSDTFIWYFGDGTTSTLENPIHAYSSYGSYQVSLVAMNANGCRDSTSQSVQVYPLPVSDFTVESVCFGSASRFTNTSQITSGTLTYLWDFGDGTSSTEINPQHTYALQGDYTVMLTTTSDNGCSTQSQRTVGIYEQPVAAFSVESICADTVAVFVNETIGTSLTYLWSFGDGQQSNEVSPTHPYSSAGTYSATLLVTSGSGCTDTYRADLLVKPMPEINFVFEEVCDTVPVSFTNLSTIASGSIAYTWEFGDGTGSSLKEPQHLFPSDGNYVVVLTGNSDGGCQTAVSKSLRIFPRPEASFTTSAVCDGSPTQFVNTSTINSGSVQRFSWDFGDGTNAIVENPEKQYLNKGEYDVTLEVYSDKGCESAYSMEVGVNEFPVANFEVENVCLGNSIAPENLSFISSGDLTYTWDFGDGDIKEGYAPMHTYSNAGVFTIALSATSSTGCSDQIQKDVRIYAAPDVWAGPDTVISQGYEVSLSASGGVDYVWSPADVLSNSNIAAPVASPMETTTFEVLVTDEFGCQNTATTTVTVNTDFRVVVNNVFTPDDNGINDTWVVQNIESFETANVRVYDRYGTLVFQDKAYQNDWKGTRGKDLLPDGTYYYLITFSDSSKEYKGAVTILRNR